MDHVLPVKPKRLRLPKNAPKRIRTGRERWDSASDILLDRQKIVGGALLRNRNTAMPACGTPGNRVSICHQPTRGLLSRDVPDQRGEWWGDFGFARDRRAPA